MDLNGLVKRAVPFTFVYDDFELKGKFYKYRITPDYLDTLDKMKEQGASEQDAGYQILADSIESWDMRRGGKAFPPTVENLKQVPMVYLIALGRYIGELRDGNPTNGASSPSTS